MLNGHGDAAKTRLLVGAVLFLGITIGLGGQTTGSVDADKSALMAEGQAVFAAECVTCHSLDGGGDVGPALGGSAGLASTDAVLRRLLEGVKDMPAFASSLSNRQLAAVVTFVRNSWENDYGVVREGDAARVRASLPPPAPRP